MLSKMSKESSNANKSVIRFSIAAKLNARFIIRLIGVMLSMDIFLCTAFTVCQVVYAERTTTKVAKVLIKSIYPQESLKEWLDVTGYNVAIANDNEANVSKGILLPVFMRKLFPRETANASRIIDMPGGDIKRLTYATKLELNGRTYVISILIGQTVNTFFIIMIILSIMQSITILKSVFTEGRIIRKILRPIAELAQTAQNLNSVAASISVTSSAVTSSAVKAATVTAAPNFKPEGMRRLAGKLDGIDAEKLGTRISLDDTQDELKTLAYAINSMLDRINESYRSQIRFVSDASHELRTPISVIQGYANLLSRWGKNDEKTLQESIDAIKSEAANMKSMVEQLLFLARGDSDTLVLKIENFDLAEIANEVFRETEMIDDGHEYESRLSSVFVSADMALIKQALRILVDNAIKYTDPGGHIIIAVSMDGESGRLTVQDDGIGIQAEAVAQIVERFYRADASRARATGGTGLGLSIAKWIAEKHGGYIDILSREDIGTRISIVIPALLMGDNTV